MARKKFNNPWGHENSPWFNEEKEKWSGENLGESGEKNLSRPEEENLPQQGPINVAIFKTGIKREPKTDAVFRFHFFLEKSNPDPSGIKGWRIIYVKDISHAKKKLADLAIKNLFIGSHGEYDTAEFSIGHEVVDRAVLLDKFRGVMAKNIILGACFIANDLFPEGTVLMRTLANICQADVYGNMGYTFDDYRMWNPPSEIFYVLAGIDSLYPYGEVPYATDGAGRWVKVSPVGNPQEFPPLFLTRNGKFGLLNGTSGMNNAWRSQPLIQEIIRELKANEPRHPSGAGGDIIPSGGGFIID